MPVNQQEPSFVSSYLAHGCRTYWGHCGCDLFRGHPGPHVGLHLPVCEEDDTDVHIVPRGSSFLFGEDSER